MEDKIVGPITVRQFVILLATALVLTVAYKLVTLFTFIVLFIVVGGIGVTFAIVKINGQAFHYFVLNLIQTFRLPPLRVWHKVMTTEELRDLVKQPPPVKVTPTPKKEPLSTTKLAELTLVVNTGGVYRPEEW